MNGGNGCGGGRSRAVIAEPVGRDVVLGQLRRPRVESPGELFIRSSEVERVMSGHSKWATTKHKKAVIDA
ncbi:hypothetical protein, partial [Mycolicibacter nonchromogenicus]|uniref:hypothetical protein n=1 Tax=Mycolicibacter nonchromogenicus TaxID=1782 RepID=UPI001AD80ACC